MHPHAPPLGAMPLGDTHTREIEKAAPGWSTLRELRRKGGLDNRPRLHITARVCRRPVCHWLPSRCWKIRVWGAPQLCRTCHLLALFFSASQCFARPRTHKRQRWLRMLFGQNRSVVTTAFHWQRVQVLFFKWCVDKTDEGLGPTSRLIALKTGHYACAVHVTRSNRNALQYGSLDFVYLV